MSCTLNRVTRRRRAGRIFNGEKHASLQTERNGEYEHGEDFLRIAALEEFWAGFHDAAKLVTMK